jgi:hypothetical protein
MVGSSRLFEQVPTNLMGRLEYRGKEKEQEPNLVDEGVEIIYN